MNNHQLEAALQVGADAADRARDNGAELFIGGEMGVGNTTAATAIYCVLLDVLILDAVGAGSGLDRDGMLHKMHVIRCILNRHRSHFHDPLEVLRRMGGFEVAAQTGLPVLVDGLISTAAALLAIEIQPAVADWLFLSHTSAEPGHFFATAELQQRPLLGLGLRLGEGSGAAIAVPLLRMACQLHNRMATFDEAAIDAKL